MKNIRYILLISTCCFLPKVGIAEINLTFDASDIVSSNPTLHTHHTPVVLKPISNSIKLAAVCSLGSGGCDDESFNLDNIAQCKDEGFTNSCPNGEKIKVGSRCPHDDSYGTCCKENCPDNSSTTCSGSVIGNDGCGYNCYQCDPCPGYYPCGGTWQYCTGTKCSKDPTRCSNFCVDDYFTTKCDKASDCKGVYRNGYCSGSCTPACVETCYGDTIRKNDEGWNVSSCSTCSGNTLYTNTPKSCPAGYSTSVSSCDTSGGYRLVTSGKSGNDVCGSCTNSACPDGYATFVKTCNTGYQLETNGVSGGLACGKCVIAPCPEGYSTDVRSCSSAYSLKSLGKSGALICRKCECTATNTTCSGKIFNADTYEETDSCMRDGTKYVACGTCTREGGTAEGYASCLSNGTFNINPDTRPGGATTTCNGITYYKSCGCNRDGWKLYSNTKCGASGYPDGSSGYKTYNKSGINYAKYYHRGLYFRTCDDVGFKTYNGCALYSCSNPNHKVIKDPKKRYSNSDVICCPGDNPDDPNCVVRYVDTYFPDDEL